MWWNYLSIPKLQRLHRWSLGMDKKCHPTLYNVCNHLSLLRLKLNHVGKRGPWYLPPLLHRTISIKSQQRQYPGMYQALEPVVLIVLGAVDTLFLKFSRSQTPGACLVHPGVRDNFIQHVNTSVLIVLVLQMRTSLDVSAPGLCLWLLDWTCCLRTPWCHV